MNDELSITISGGTPPTWHVRSTHDNYPSAFKALEKMRDSGRRAGKISVLTWLGKVYSETVTVDNFTDAFRALELQRDAVEALVGKPAHPFMIGDRVQPDTHFTDARGTVVSLVDKTHVGVEWDGGSTRTEYVKGLRGAIEVPKGRKDAEEIIRRWIPGKFKVGDRVRKTDSGTVGTVERAYGSVAGYNVKWDGGSSSAELGMDLTRVEEGRTFKVGDRVRYVSRFPALVGTVAEVRDPVGSIAERRYRIEWDGRGNSTERADNLHLEQTEFKPGDRVRWSTQDTLTGTVVAPLPLDTRLDTTRVKWDGQVSGANNEHTRNLRLEQAAIEPGDRVQSNTSSLYGTVLKPSSVTGNDEIVVRWDSGVQNLTVKRENVKKL